MILSPDGSLMITKKTRIALCVGFAVLLVASVGFGIYRYLENSKQGTVQIAGIDDCSKGVDGSTKESVFKMAYAYVDEANKARDIESEPYYGATIRDGTCKNEEWHDSTQSGFISTMTIDVPDARQSWQINYAWVAKKEEVFVGLGPVVLSCLDKKDLIYGAFGCEELELTQLHEEGDVIVQYLPYMSKSCTVFAESLLENRLTLNVIVQIKPSEKKSYGLKISSCKKEISEWFVETKIDPANYDIYYQYEYL